MSALAVVPKPVSTPAPLYVVEEALAALVESAELVTPEQEAEFQEDLRVALTTAIEKRDRIGAFLAHAESQAALAAAEIKRLQQRKKSYELVVDRLETYIVRIIEAIGPDAKGKYPKLEGKTVTFALHACPPSVQVLDEQTIPSQYKTLTITIPALSWEMLLDSVEPDLRSQIVKSIGKSECAIDKKSVKQDIESGREVEGADLLINNHTLVRK